MLDSKNFLWLGSFFSLLFITFCVSTHLDDLNPHFNSIDQTITEQKDKNENNLTKSPTIFVKDVNIVQLPNDLNKKESVTKLSTEEIRKSVNSKEKNQTKQEVDTKKDFTLPNIFHEEEKNISSKAKNESLQKKEDKTLKKSRKKRVTHTKDSLKKKVPSSKLVQKLLLTKKDIARLSKGFENNNFNKMAFLYGLKRGRFITIRSSDLSTAKVIKRLLTKRFVNPKDIYIKKAQNSNLLLELKEKK